MARSSCWALLLLLLLRRGWCGEREDEVIALAKETIGTMRELMCGKVSEKEVTLAFAVGADRDRLTEALQERLKGVPPKKVRSLLRGAEDTEDFDFRVFERGAADAAVGPSVMAFWQELAAAYPRSRIVVALGDEAVRPASRRCDSIEEDVAAYGSPCPTALQIAKYEDMAVQELLENGPNVHVIDARGLFRKKDLLLENATTRRDVVWRPRLEDWFPSPPKKKGKTNLIVCPGSGATGTKSLAQALAMVYPDDYIDHNHRTPELLRFASSDASFGWDRRFQSFRAVVDTPIPGYWQELVLAHPSSVVILTTRSENYHRTYASMLDLRSYGVSQDQWRSAAKAGHLGDLRRVKPEAFPPLGRRRRRRLLDDACATRRKCLRGCLPPKTDDLTPGLIAALARLGERHCKVHREVEPYDVAALAKRDKVFEVQRTRLGAVPKSRLNFETTSFLFSDRCVVRSRSCDHSCRGKNFWDFFYIFF